VRIAALISIIWLLPATVLAQAATSYPELKGAVIGDYARITFTWPERTKFNVSRTGSTIFIKFAKPMQNVSFAPILRKLSGLVTKVSMTQDKRTLVFELKQPYELRSFVSGRGGGVDLLAIDQAQPVEDTSQVAVAPEPQEENALPWEQKEEAPEPAQEAAAPRETMALPVEEPVVTVEEPVGVDVAEKAVIEATSEPFETQVKVEAPVPVAKPEETPEPQAQEEAVEVAQAETQESPVIELPETPLKPAVPKPKEVIASVKQEPRPEVQEATSPITALPKPVSVPEGEEVSVIPNKREQPPAPKPVPVEPPQLAIKPADAPKGKYPELPIKVYDNEGEILLEFGWEERTGAAIFTYDRALWFVFDKPVMINEEVIAFRFRGAKVTHEVVDDRYTVLKVTTPQPFFAFVNSETKEDKNPRGTYMWSVSVSRFETSPIEEIIPEPIVNSDEPHIMVTNIQTAEPLTIEDKTRGGKLFITPIYEQGRGVFPSRNFVEATMLPTAQGIVVRQIDEAVEARLVRGGVKVTKPGGLIISKDLPKLEAGAALLGSKSKTLFPTEEWSLKKGEFFVTKVGELAYNVARTKRRQRHEARLKLAQLYLNEGLAPEANRILLTIAEDSPRFFKERKLAALVGASNFLINRVDEAVEAFEAEELQEITEIRFWRNLMKFFQGKRVDSLDYLAFEPDYISKYPAKLRNKIAILAADHSIVNKDYERALEIIETLSGSPAQDISVKRYVDFMLATIASQTKQVPLALEVWGRLAKLHEDRFIRARAEYSLVSLQLREGIIDVNEAIRRLDLLRIIWRDDSLEMNLLSYLGDLYYQEGKYVESLRTWGELVNTFASSTMGLATLRKMTETFQFLYAQGGSMEMTPLDALSLYYEFQDLTPIGAQGDRVIQGLTDRLVSMDLLTQAAGLLKHQVEFRLTGEERARVAARLALIYLLDEEPQKALDILKLTSYGQIPDTIIQQRLHLTAKALADLDRIDEATDVLSNDLSFESQLLKLEIFWQANNWRKVVGAAEEILIQREKINAPLNPQEGIILTRLAVAYSLLGEKQQLLHLREYFIKLMQGNPYQEAFSFLTNVEQLIDPDSFSEVVKDINKLQDFMEHYRDNLKAKGLSGTIG
jgi:tetratricopeptide (TPR) repeat protein